MKMVRNMAFYYGGKFYATQGGPVRLGYSVSEAQLPPVWDTEVITSYPQRITKDTLQFTLIDSDAAGITGSLNDFNPDDGGAMCARDLRLYVVIGDETTGAGCPLAGGGQNLGVLCVKQCSAYVLTVAPSTITVDGERVETLTVTFRATTPFKLMEVVPKLQLPVYESVFTAAGFSCGVATRPAGAYTIEVNYGETMPVIPAFVAAVVADPEAQPPVVGVPQVGVAAAPVVAGKTFAGLADSEGTVYYNVVDGAYVAAIEKFNRLLPIGLYYKYIVS